ncbi:MAG TPA: hypothetical protein VFI33_12645 [Puia sp.]|nr:hypothetical protein [Puia sp.]
MLVPAAGFTWQDVDTYPDEDPAAVCITIAIDPDFNYYSEI